MKKAFVCLLKMNHKNWWRRNTTEEKHYVNHLFFFATTTPTSGGGNGSVDLGVASVDSLGVKRFIAEVCSHFNFLLIDTLYMVLSVKDKKLVS